MSAKVAITKGLSRKLALRIGLAAQAAGIEARDLVGTLVAHFGLPLTPKTLANITAETLAELLDSKLARPELEKAADFLNGKSVISDEPEVEAYQDGDMPQSIRVAVASNSGELLDGHFASCETFLIYQVSADEVRLVDSCPTAPAHAEEDKTVALVQLIQDCHVLFVVSIGGPAAAKVVKAGIHPIKRPQVGPARDAIADLQRVLAGTPPPWLAKVLGATPEERVRFSMEEEA